MAQVTGGPRGGTLNVIFHGSCAFLLEKGVNAVIPNIKDYTIVAGTFLQEQPLAKGGRYTLRGVNPPEGPAARIATGDNIFIVGVKLKPDADIFCEIQLPKPAAVHSLRPVPIESDWFPKPPADFKFGSELALVHVFRYRFAEASALALEDAHGNRFHWDPVYDFGSHTVNLHVYSDPKDNSIKQDPPALTLLLRLFGLDVPLDLAAVGAFVPPAEIYPEIPGLEVAVELRDYASGRPATAQVQPPYHCTQLFGLVQQGDGSSAGGDSLGYSVSVDAA